MARDQLTGHRVGNSRRNLSDELWHGQARSPIIGL